MYLGSLFGFLDGLSDLVFKLNVTSRKYTDVRLVVTIIIVTIIKTVYINYIT